MTTVDFYIETAAGDSLLSFHNGMWGPATDLLHSAFKLARAGTMSPSRFNVAEMESMVTGAVLRELLQSVQFEATNPRSSPTRDDVVSVLDSIDDAASYRIFGLEV